MAFGITVSDDFNRPDNQNVSIGSSFAVYEKPINEADSIIFYNGEKDVYVQSQELIITEPDNCDFTTAVINFKEYINISDYNDGNISFTWKIDSKSNDNRWYSHIVFGDDLEKTPAVTNNCGGTPSKQWNTALQENSSFMFLQVEGSEKDKIVVSNYRCGNIYVPAEDIGFNQEYQLTLYFDIAQNRTKLIVENTNIEFMCNLKNAKQINSMAIQVLSNQGNDKPNVTIDNLAVTINNKPSINPLLQKYSPVFYMHPREPYHLNELGSLMDESSLYKQSDLMSLKPTTFEEIKDLEQSHKYYMDMGNVDTTVLNDFPNPDDFSDNQPKVYATYVEEDHFTHLQYYVFYPFQKYLIANHEGDFELIQVTLDESNQIHSVGYFFNLFSMWFYDTDELEYIDGTHPVVLVGKGSHNNFPDTGEIEIPMFLQHLEFFYDLMNELKNLETLEKGTPYVPKEVELEDSVEYELEEIKLSWMNYEGLWGQKTHFKTTSGPKSPKFDPRFMRHWYHPDTHAYGPNIPFLSFFIYSPVDMTVLKDGTEVEYDFYTGPENEPEALTVLGKGNHTLLLEATGEGQFTLHMYVYDNETDSGIMLKFRNISIGENSKGRMDATIGSDFILYLDYEGDGEYESELIPDEYLVYGNYTLPDTDNDTVNNFDDNCISIANSNQADTNNDGLGDACDSPRYYKEKALSLIEDKPKKYHMEYARRKVEASLDERYWINDFEIRSIMVFVDEAAASRKLNDEISYLLAKADKMILEEKFEQTDYSELRRAGKLKYKFAEDLYKLANRKFSKGDYTEAILLYMKAWVYL